MMNRPQAGSYEKPLFVSTWKAHWNTPVKNGKTLPDLIPDKIPEKISAHRTQRDEARRPPRGEQAGLAHSVGARDAGGGETPA